VAKRRLLVIIVTASFVLVDLDLEFLAGGRGLNPASVAMFVTLAAASVAIHSTSRPVVLLPRQVVVLLLWVLVATPFGVHPGRSLVAWLLLVAAAMTGSNREHAASAPATVWGIWLGSFLITAASIVAEVFNVLGRSNGRLQGLTLEPNMLGHLAGLGVVAAMLIARDNNYRVLASLPLFLYAILESETRTVWLALIVAISALAWTQSRLRLVALGVLVGLLIVIGGLDTSIADVARRSESESLTELSGRVDIWRWSLANILDRPVFGAGLASGPTQLTTTGFDAGLSLASASSHSLPVDVARETGLFGLVVATILLGAALRTRNLLMVPLVAYLIVTALTMPMSGFAGLVTVAWFAVVARGRPGAEDLTEPDTSVTTRV